MVDGEKLSALLGKVRGHAGAFGGKPGMPVGSSTISIEEHGSAEVLYVGRDPGSHGLNIVTISDPSYQWPDVKALLLGAVNDLPAMLDELEEWRSGFEAATGIMTATPHKSQVEAYRNLEAELNAATRLVSKLGDILTRTANALKGEPDELSMHSWHDLPEVASAMVSERDGARHALVAMLGGRLGHLKNCAHPDKGGEPGNECDCGWSYVVEHKLISDEHLARAAAYEKKGWG